MGELWRSKHMDLVQMIVHNDAASVTVNKLGDTGIVELRDVRPSPTAPPRSPALTRSRTHAA